MKDRLRNSFNISIAEIEVTDLWQRATLGVVSISDSRDYLEGLMRNVEHAAVTPGEQPWRRSGGLVYGLSGKRRTPSEGNDREIGVRSEQLGNRSGSHIPCKKITVATFSYAARGRYVELLITAISSYSFPALSLVFS